MWTTTRGFQTFCHVDGLQSQADGPFPIAVPRGGELVAVGLIDQHLRRERAEVMQTGNDEGHLLAQFEDLVHDGRAQPVAQFDGIETELENLLNDFFAGFVALRIPTCRK